MSLADMPQWMWEQICNEPGKMQEMISGVDTGLVEVLEEDIEGGSVGSSCYCPIALALGRKYNRPVNAYLQWAYDNAPTAIAYDERTSRAEILGYFDKDTTDWLRSFDRGDPVKPFQFRLWPVTFGPFPLPEHKE